MLDPAGTAIPFVFVDVFTDVPLAGNPLAVVPHGPGLDDAALRRLAREFNQSETTFLFPPTQPQADWLLRSFTPTGVEVFGAGHNALGAWWWLAASGLLMLPEPTVHFHQQFGARVLPLTIQTANGRPIAVGMTQAAPTFGAVVADRDALAHALGLNSDDLSAGSLPAQVVATDVAHLLVPVRRDALPRARPQPDRITELVHAHGGEGCYVFSLETRDAAATADARFFNPGVGIAEDPATGTAAGPLAAYLVHNKATTEPRVIIDQGLQTGRPSRLEVQVIGSHIELRGAAVVTAEGTIRIR
jgi:PhzF family phenazine biosynthesis protein